MAASAEAMAAIDNPLQQGLKPGPDGGDGRSDRRRNRQSTTTGIETLCFHNYLSTSQGRNRQSTTTGIETGRPGRRQS